MLGGGLVYLLSARDARRLTKLLVRIPAIDRREVGDAKVADRCRPREQECGGPFAVARWGQQPHDIGDPPVEHLVSVRQDRERSIGGKRESRIGREANERQARRQPCRKVRER